jgi:uncharacterized repeat protein (TIGR03917 family)
MALFRRHHSPCPKEVRMIAMREPGGEPAGVGVGVGSASAAGGTRGTTSAGAEPDEPVARGGPALAVHEVELVPGTSRAEFVSTMLDQVPGQARFVEADGDVDVTLRWRTDDLGVLDLLVHTEAAAWRRWRDAEQRARDFSRLHRRATDLARTAHSAWYQTASDLVEQHPEFANVDPASVRRASGGSGGSGAAGGSDAADVADAGLKPAVSPDLRAGRLPSRTELAAQALLGRLQLGEEGLGTEDEVVADREDEVLDREDDVPDSDDLYRDDPGRDGYEAALEAWHASADLDGIDVPLMPGEDVVAVGEQEDWYAVGVEGDGPVGEVHDGRDETGATRDGVQSPE